MRIRKDVARQKDKAENSGVDNSKGILCTTIREKIVYDLGRTINTRIRRYEQFAKRTDTNRAQ